MNYDKWFTVSLKRYCWQNMYFLVFIQDWTNRYSEFSLACPDIFSNKNIIQLLDTGLILFFNVITVISTYIWTTLIRKIFIGAARWRQQPVKIQMYYFFFSSLFFLPLAYRTILSLQEKLDKMMYKGRSCLDLCNVWETHKHGQGSKYCDDLQVQQNQTHWLIKYIYLLNSYTAPLIIQGDSGQLTMS